MKIILLIVIIVILILVVTNTNPKFSQVSTKVESTKDCIINVLCLIRDAESYLVNNLNSLEKFCKSNFKDYKIFFVENNSVDRTVEILKNKMDENNKIIGIFLNDLSKKHSLRLCKSTEPVNCNKRTRLLATLRQTVLTLSLLYDSDITLMTDCDFKSFDQRGLVDMTNLFIKEKYDGIFGMSYKDGDMYDRDAIVTYDNQKINDVYDKIRKETPETVRVKSAFSGFGIYNTTSIKNKKAEYNLENTDIEHIDFNKCLDKLYIYTKFKPLY